MFDVETIRKDFPVLERQVHGRPVVYLNSAATAQKPRVVIDAISRFYETCNSNVHRGVDALSEEATEAFESARARIARFVGADPRGLVFTRNATEAFNIIAYSYARPFLGPGDILLSTQMEHHANIVPWQLVQPLAGFDLRFVPVTPDGLLDLEAFDEIVATGRVKLFTVTHMSNVVGTINPVAELAARVRAANPEAVVAVDGAQSVPHMPVDLLALDADFLCFSGHKMCGPAGIGALAGKPELLDRMPPFLGGGEMISNVTLEGTTFNEVPYKFEAGTPATAEAVGLGVAVDYLSALGMADVRAHEVELLGAALPALEAVDGVTVHGPHDPEDRGAAISFAVEGLHPHDIGTIMDREGVMVRAGHHCAKPLVRVLGAAATTRASFYLYSTAGEIGALVDAIEATKRFFDR
ncbi:MAG: SufS family cysteine desulfurase [Nitriliruptorales bacterium]|nr:SufS family cysteine desulfurase [Nitriliruptorales bacterium]